METTPLSLPAPPASGCVAEIRQCLGPEYKGQALGSVGISDEDLVNQFRRGDEAAFDEIISRHRGKVYSVALAMLRNHSDAEEITQDTFIRAHRALATFRGDSAVYTWLHRITVNLARNRYWYFFRRHRHETDSLDNAISEGTQITFGDLIVSELPDPARETANLEFSVHVAECMAKLSAPQQRILRMRYNLETSYEKIAETLEINVGTVKSRLARARVSLRALLGEVYVGYNAGSAKLFHGFEPERSPAGLDRAFS